MVGWPWVPFACSTAGLQLLSWPRFFIVSPFNFKTCTGLRWKVTFMKWLCLSSAIKKNGVKSSEVRERYSKQRSKSRRRVIVRKQCDWMCHPETDGMGSQQVFDPSSNGGPLKSFKWTNDEVTLCALWKSRLLLDKRMRVEVVILNQHDVE